MLHSLMDPSPSSAPDAQDPLDALDRGVIDAGLAAAEAIARVQKLERIVTTLVRGMNGVNENAGLPPVLPRPPWRERAAALGWLETRQA